MGVATAISLGLAAAGGIKQAIDASNAKAEADNAAQQEAMKLARINEADKFKSLQVPTLGLELAQQNIQARQQENIQALKEGGAATVLGGLTANENLAREQDLQLAAQANQMQYARDQAQAQNAQQIEQNRAQREAALAQSRLQGAQTMGAQARNAEQAAYAGLAENAMNAAFSYNYFNDKNNPGTIDKPLNKNNYGTIWDAQKAGQQNAITSAPTFTAAMNAAQSVNTPQISAMPAQNTAQPKASYPGMYNVNTGDPLVDMYTRNAALGDLWMYVNPRF